MYTDSEEFIAHSRNTILYSDAASLPLHTIMALFTTKKNPKLSLRKVWRGQTVTSWRQEKPKIQDALN